MNPPLGPDPDLLHRLRAVRRQELASTARQALPKPTEGPEEHRASLTQVHDDVRTVLNRIDAAEAAMRPVLHAWAQDPARGGAHLLVHEGEEPPGLQETLTMPTAEWPSPPQDELLPDTLRPADEPPP